MKRCVDCTHWTEAGCSHPRNKGSGSGVPCGRYRYANRYDEAPNSPVLTAMAGKGRECPSCRKVKPEGEFTDMFGRDRALCSFCRATTRWKDPRKDTGPAVPAEAERLAAEY